MRILITGANGFVGRALTPECCARGHSVIAATRDGDKVDPNAQTFRIGDLSRDPDWRQILKGVDVVVHLAARVHQRVGAADLDQESNLRVNYYATRALARAAIAAGVSRFIFISTVQAQADMTEEDLLTEEDTPHPIEPYARTKQSAEVALNHLFANTQKEQSACELTVLRPTLVYGPEVRANFSALMRGVQFGLPLPFRSVENRRSMLYIGNLVDAIVTVAEAQTDASGAFLLKDGRDISTRELIEAIGTALERTPLLFSLPPLLLRVLAGLVGQPGLARRLLYNLAVDDSKFRTRFNWSPPFTQEQGFKQTAKWLLGQS